MSKINKLVPIPDYIGFGNSLNKGYITKSRPLQSLSETDLTLPELKILDAYLARINSHDSEKRTVKFEKGELEHCLGISRILQDDLEKRLRNLFQVIKLKDPHKEKGFTLINLFEKADAEQDDYGLWQITLTCTQAAREYIFNIDNLGYLRYRLKNIINLTSRYSYILFLYLTDNRFRKQWTISLDDLKKLLNCTAETYTQYKRFNDLILKKCYNELTEKTDLRFYYTPIKKGRSIAEIQFTVETIEEIDTAHLPENRLCLNETNSDYETISFLSEACENEFSNEEMWVIFDLVAQAIPEPQNELERFNYLSHQYHILNQYAEKNKINNRFNYLKKIIEKSI